MLMILGPLVREERFPGNLRGGQKVSWTVLEAVAWFLADREVGGLQVEGTFGTEIVSAKGISEMLGRRAMRHPSGEKPIGTGLGGIVTMTRENYAHHRHPGSARGHHRSEACVIRETNNPENWT